MFFMSGHCSVLPGSARFFVRFCPVLPGSAWFFPVLPGSDRFCSVQPGSYRLRMTQINFARSCAVLTGPADSLPWNTKEKAPKPNSDRPFRLFRFFEKMLKTVEIVENERKKHVDRQAEREIQNKRHKKRDSRRKKDHQRAKATNWRRPEIIIFWKLLYFQVR